MKKQLVLTAMAVLIGLSSINAQGGFQRRTVEERVKSVHEKLDSAFKPDAIKMASIDSIFTVYYTAQDKVREEMMASGTMDRDAMRAKMQELADVRDGKLKTVLTEAEMKTWKEAIEPSMRPQRGNRPPGGGK
jgi:periplasmic protein CpxP/Spy